MVIAFSNKTATGYIKIVNNLVVEYSFETNRNLSEKIRNRFFNFISKKQLTLAENSNIWV